MKTLKTLTIVLAVFSTGLALAQKKEAKEPLQTMEMKMYLVEREMPGAGELTPGDLKGASQVSCDVLKEMGTGIEWINSYVLDDKLYCVYKAQNKELIKEHAEKGGFPCNKITEIRANIGPSTAVKKID